MRSIGYLAPIALLVALGWPAGAQISAEEVLLKLRSSYAAVKAVHLVVERQETIYPQGHAFTSLSECELAAAAGNRYFARLKQANGEALAVSDGSHIWKALVAAGQWTQVSAAAPEAAGDEEDSGPPDFADILKGMLFGHFPAMAKAAQGAAIIKEEDFKLGREKVRCYLIRLRTNGAEHEVLVDKQRYLVLRSKQKSQSVDGRFDIELKTKLLETNEQVDKMLFAFQPDAGWKEVETLVLPGERRMVLIGERAANFTLKALDGEPVALVSLRGKIVVLDFWATWCPPCRAELPSIEKLRTEFGDEVQFYGINDEASSTVKKFVGSNHYATPVLLDDKGEVHRRYGVRAIPALFVIDRDGVVRQQFLGSQGEQLLRKAIQSAVDSKAM